MIIHLIVEKVNNYRPQTIILILTINLTITTNLIIVKSPSSESACNLGKWAYFMLKRAKHLKKAIKNAE